MLPPAQHVANPGGTTGKQRNVLEVARERVAFVSLAIAMIWSSITSASAGVSAPAERTRKPQEFPRGSTASRTAREARESRQSRSSLRFGGNLKDGGAVTARNSIPNLLGSIHPDGADPTTNRSDTKHVIITLFARRIIGSTESQPEAPPPHWPRRWSTWSVPAPFLQSGSASRAAA